MENFLMNELEQYNTILEIISEEYQKNKKCIAYEKQYCEGLKGLAHRKAYLLGCVQMYNKLNKKQCKLETKEIFEITAVPYTSNLEGTKVCECRATEIATYSIVVHH